MTGYRNPLEVLGARPTGRPLLDLSRAAEIAADRERRLAEHFEDFVSGNPQPAGDETQATPASRRHSPERDGAAGRRDAGDGQHQLHVVEPGGQLIDATDRFSARRRNHFNNGSAA